MTEFQPRPTPFEARPSETPRRSEAPGVPTDVYRAPSLDQPHALLAGCSYLGVLFLAPLLMQRRQDEFVKFHLRQGIVLFALGVVASFGFHVRQGGSLLMLAVFVVSLVGAFHAWRGEKWVLPVLGKYAAKIEL